MAINSWDMLWDKAQSHRLAGEWAECISTCRTLAKRSPRYRKSAVEWIGVMASIRNAFRHDEDLVMEYFDDVIGGDPYDDPYLVMNDWEDNGEFAEYEDLIQSKGDWPFLKDTDYFGGKHEWAEHEIERHLLHYPRMS